MDIKNLARRYGPGIGLTIAALAYYPRFVKGAGGMMLYPQAAECLLSHQSIPDCAIVFTYPPAFAFLIIPFVSLPMWARDVVWYLVTWAALVGVWRGSEYLTRRLYPGDWTERELFVLRMSTALLSLKFILAVLENQAYDLLVLVLIVAGLCAIAGARAKLGAVGLAVATAIKATPLVFLPWLIVRRHYAAAATFVLVVIALSLLPDLFLAPDKAAHGHLVTWLSNIASPALRNGVGPDSFVFWAGVNLQNHSLRGAIARLIDESAHPELFKTVLFTAWLIFAAVVGVLLLKSPGGAAYTGVDGSILLIAMLMLSPMTSRSHYVQLLLPFMVMTAAAIRDRARRSLAVTVLSVSFILTTASSNDLVGGRITDWSYFYSLMGLGALVLMAGLAVLIVSGAAASDDARSRAPALRAANMPDKRSGRDMVPDNARKATG